MFTATSLAADIARGALTSASLAAACVERIGSDGPAWTGLSATDVEAQAQAMDRIRCEGRPTGRLHGVPVGIPDALAGSQPGRACAGVAVSERLVEAGALVIGHTSGTTLARAVARTQLPLAVASPGTGEAMRDASHHGIYGFKPTRGVISRRGARLGASSFDQLGVLGRSLEDVALLVDVLGGYDAADDESYLRPRPDMLRGVREDAPVRPAFVRLELALEDDHAPATALGIAELVDALGGDVDTIEASSTFEPLVAAQRMAEAHECGRDPDADAYARAMRVIQSAESFIDDFFNDYDAVIGHAAFGEAAEHDSHIPALSRVAAACGLPSVSLPLLEGDSGLPVNVLLMGGREEDHRLLRSARWLMSQLQQA